MVCNSDNNDTFGQNIRRLLRSTDPDMKMPDADKERVLSALSTSATPHQGPRSALGRAFKGLKDLNAVKLAVTLAVCFLIGLGISWVRGIPGSGKTSPNEVALSEPADGTKSTISDPVDADLQVKVPSHSVRAPHAVEIADPVDADTQEPPAAARTQDNGARSVNATASAVLTLDCPAITPEILVKAQFAGFASDGRTVWNVVEVSRGNLPCKKFVDSQLLRSMDWGRYTEEQRKTAIASGKTPDYFRALVKKYNPKDAATDELADFLKSEELVIDGKSQVWTFGVSSCRESQTPGNDLPKCEVCTRCRPSGYKESFVSGSPDDDTP
jgi:hypothetical protein